ncbi:hypothetical protein [Alicyclobacillus sp. SO9]|uniref:hypothetical protein n=1 Tax=Alicyclobacillus sp. SO9 TaxID=2665646 RepID=UPI001E402682|nr:hypothetical protein [Alicyclobacillus sp. SO9]
MLQKLKKRYFVPSLVIALIFLGCGVYVNFFASSITTDGPLAMAAGGMSKANGWTECVMGKPDQIMYFGSDPFPINNKHTRNMSVIVTSVKPAALPHGLKQIGMGTMKGGPEFLGGSLKWVENHSSYPIQSLPITLPLNKIFYQPVITVEASSPGLYTIPGLVVKYTSQGQTYTDYFRGDFQLAVNTTCPNNLPTPPKRAPGMPPQWLAWMKVPR